MKAGEVRRDRLKMGKSPMDRLHAGDIVLDEPEEILAQSEIFFVDPQFPDDFRNAIFVQGHGTDRLRPGLLACLLACAKTFPRFLHRLASEESLRSYGLTRFYKESL